jgi:hypothetical protein
LAVNGVANKREKQAELMPTAFRRFARLFGPERDLPLPE